MKSYIKDYPRPQLVRTDWYTLNGSWNFAFDDSNLGETSKWMETFPDNPMIIQVPFSYETKASGIGDTSHHNNVWYQKNITVTAAQLQDHRLLLHFEGSDFLTKLWVNGRFIGQRQGGYARFSFDITDFIKEGDNNLTVKAEDSMSQEQPRGKQRWIKDNFACWYVQTTGIWKTVWMEFVPEVYLKNVKMTPDLAKGCVSFTYTMNPEISKVFEDSVYTLETEITFGDNFIQKSSKVITQNTISDVIYLAHPSAQWGIHQWTPEEPNLYDVTIRILKNDIVLDEVRSYFGMRDVKIYQGNVLLNGRPIYQKLILDQGYWEDSHLTPPSEEALIEDIDKIHALGFNGLRKHMKIEDERFLYWCDVKGMLVWSEMAATYQFTDAAVEEFTKEWLEVVKQNYNHPCIITWTPFNESWGVPEIMTDPRQQAFTESIYHLTKSIDAMRPVITNDGWEHTISDLLTLHDYEETGEAFYARYADHLQEIMTNQIFHNDFKSALANGYSYQGQPVILSEYGGIAFSGGKEGEWGYGNTVSTEEEFLARLEKITDAIKKVPYIKGYCYTQVSDVQQEINGLLNARHEFKIDPAKIKKINDK